MLKEKIEHLKKELEKMKERLRELAKDSKAAEALQKQVENMLYSWREDFERPMEQLLEHIKETQKIIKRD